MLLSNIVLTLLLLLIKVCWYISYISCHSHTVSSYFSRPALLQTHWAILIWFTGYCCKVYQCDNICLCVLADHPEFNEGDGKGQDIGVHRSQTVHNRRRRWDSSAQRGENSSTYFLLDLVPSMINISRCNVRFIKVNYMEVRRFWV